MEGSRGLLGKLMRLQWLMQRRHMQGHGERGPFMDPTRGQGRVLALLKEEISTKDLSYLLGIRQQSLNELLNKLERAGYILRAPLETDRRVMVVKLTEKGRAARQEEPDGSDLFDCLTQEEQAVLDGFLDRLIARLDEELGGDEEAWVERARASMGDEMFEHLMSSMRGRGHRDGRRRDTRDGGRGPYGHGGPEDMRGCP